MTEYVELHARSAFSFLEGASSPEEMAAVSAELGMPAMALLDSNGVYGTARLHTAMKRLGLRAIVMAPRPAPRNVRPSMWTYFPRM